MKIITVCGLGVGSSLILKMTVDSAMQILEKECDIEHWDMGTVRGKPFDLLVTTEGFRDNFIDLDNVVYITNIVDVAEVQTKLEQYFQRKETSC